MYAARKDGDGRSGCSLHATASSLNTSSSLPSPFHLVEEVGGSGTLSPILSRSVAKAIAASGASEGSVGVGTDGGHAARARGGGGGEEILSRTLETQLTSVNGVRSFGRSEGRCCASREVSAGARSMARKGMRTNALDILVRRFPPFRFPENLGGVECVVDPDVERAKEDVVDPEEEPRQDEDGSGVHALRT